jgi:origin recognition complex subunit 2
MDDDLGLYATPSRYDEDEDEYDRDDYDEQAEFGIAEEDQDEDLDDEVDEDGDEMDGVLRTPSKKGRGARGPVTPSSTPGRRKAPATPASGRGRKTPKRKTVADIQAEWLQKMMRPEAEGYIKPTAADAYFIAAARPKRKRAEEQAELDRERLTREMSNPGKNGLAKSSRGKRNDLDDIAPMSRTEIVASLSAHNASQYDSWSNLLSTGHNLIYYGYGSKRDLLNDFADQKLASEGHIISVDGLYPGLTIKDVLVEIEETFPDVKTTPVPEQEGLTRAIDKLAYRIYTYFLPSSSLPDPHPFKVSEKPLYLILNNIDGPGLRTERSLSLLSLLACSPRIHLMTSFDHVHTPILFSTTLNTTRKHIYADGMWQGKIPESRGYDWVWIEAPTHAPYDVEARYARQAAAMTGRGFTGADESTGQHGEVTEEGVLRILQSVPPMARRLFKLLATRQLSALPATEKPNQSVSLVSAQTAPVFAIDSDILQKLAKDRFIAREEERFNSQLTEYKDHGVIVEHGMDHENRVGRWLWIPLSKEVLTKVLATMEDVEA